MALQAASQAPALFSNPNFAPPLKSGHLSSLPCSSCCVSLPPIRELPTSPSLTSLRDGVRRRRCGSHGFRLQPSAARASSEGGGQLQEKMAVAVRESEEKPWLEFERAVDELDMARAFDLLEVIESREVEEKTMLPRRGSSSTSLDMAVALNVGGKEREGSEMLLEEERQTAVVEIVDEREEATPSIRERRSLRLLDAALTATDMRLVMAGYQWLKDRGLLPSFGSVVPDSSNGERLVTPTVLKSAAGLEASKLSPKKWGLTGWAPLVIFGLISSLVNNGVDIRPIIVLALAAAVGDSLLLGGTGYGQVMSVWPPYKKRVIVHEAGHVVAAYLLGCPVRGVILDAMEAVRMGIRGQSGGRALQAGTQFWDSAMEEELQQGRLTSASIDRYCIVLFAGIAAEAMVYGEAEGGESDENLYKAVVGQLQPAWPLAKISNQARWSVLQAFLLLKKHRRAHEAVVRGLQEGASMGELVKAMEDAMA